MEAMGYQVELVKTQEELLMMNEEISSFIPVCRGCTTFRQDPAWMSWEFSTGAGRPLCVVIRRDGDIACLALGRLQETAFNMQFSVFKVPFRRAKKLKVVGDEFLMSPKEDAVECVSLVLQAWSGLSSDVDLVYFEMLETGGSVGKCLSNGSVRFPKGMRLYNTSPKKEFVWRHFLKPNYDDWLASLGGSTRRLVKRRIKSLEKKFPGKVELQTCSNVEDISSFLNHLDELYPKTWQAKTFGFKKRNAERDQDKFRLYADMGALRSYLLFIEGRPAAFFVGLQYRSVFEAIEIGYDSAYSSLGVGSALNYLVIQELYNDNSPEILSFGFGENAYKEMVCTDSSEAFEAYITLRKRWSLAVRIQMLLGKIEKVTREFIIRLGVADLIRKILKNKG